MLIETNGFVFAQQKGGYVQASVAYVAIQECYGLRVRTLLVGGAQHDNVMDAEGPTNRRPEVGRDETFPMYEERSVRPDPLGLRYTFPEQALGLKSTIEFIRKLPSPKNVSQSSEEEIQVLHELGIEHFDVVFDSQSLDRAVRLALNETDGGFDPRWQTGDWSSALTTDMLATPNLPLNLDDCVQSVKQLFLDENEFPSSDLFNVTARVSNVEMRLPAAILDNVRSCDVIVKLSEAMLVVSSALPRTFLSGRIGTSVNGEEAKNKGLIDFPNDPNDVAYQLERSEDPSNRQRGIMTSHAISTFRLQLTLRGASIQLVPIIPIASAEESKYLVLPSELTMIVCFEGEPPESLESNLTKIVLFTSILAHRFDLNLDLELLTAAIGTIAHHLDIITLTATACSGVTQKSQPDDMIDASEHSLDSSEGSKLRRTLAGRKVLVKRQIQQSRATGGLSVAFCLQASGINVKIWRQNVSYYSALRNCPTSEGTTPETRSKFIPLLKLLSFAVNDFELGLEATFRQNSRRVVGKMCLSGLGLQTCDFAAVRKNPDLWETNTGTQEQFGSTALLDIIMVGSRNKSDLPVEGGGECGVTVRVEEQRDRTRVWSFASDLGSGGATICCRIESIESVFLLLFEVLLLPAWTCNPGLTVPVTSGSMNFPSGSVGALFLNAVECVARVVQFEPDHVQSIINQTNRQVPSGRESILRYTLDRAIPADVEAVLFRFTGFHIMLKVPKGGSAPCSYGFHVLDAEFLATYRRMHGSISHQVMQTLCRKGRPWASVVPDTNRGLRHTLRSRHQLVSFLSLSTSPSSSTLVEPFECTYTYGKSKAQLSMLHELMIENVEMLADFLSCLQSFVYSCQALSEVAYHVLASIRPRSQIREIADVSRRNPVEVACRCAVEVIHSAREVFRNACDSFTASQSRVQTELEAKNLELALLRRLVFSKEQERLSALALVAAQLTGWLRIGSSQRIGQRGMMTWTLCAQWSVLRRNLLITYSNPGEVSRRFVR